MKFIKKHYTWILLTILTLGYAIFSFMNLGSFTNPNTFVEGNTYIYQVENPTIIYKIRYFTGHIFNQMKIYISNDNETYTLLTEEDNKYVFSWNDIVTQNAFSYLKIELEEETNLGEIAVFDERGNQLSLKPLSSHGEALIDEQATVPEKISSYNSAYFDEVYFARTSYEYATGLPVYEWVHPPLSKILASIPIRLFHMAPFYYRLVGNLAAVLMIPVIFLFAKKLFGKTRYGVIAALLLIFDNFHYTQGRIGTMDSCLALFILLSFYFMYSYLKLKKEDPLRKKQWYLFFSGLFVGCAIATKWTGFFAGLALAIVFFLHFFKTYIQNKKITKDGKKIIISCVFFFGINIFAIYLLCYFCYPNFYYFHIENFSDFIDITKQMFQYHSTLTESHPFYSSWYTWPLMIKPVWYYYGTYEGLKSSISGIGNPILWWSCAISLIFILYKIIKKDKKAILLGIFYLCMLLPYMNISRGMFLYHYYPAFLVTILSLTYLLKEIDKKIPKHYFLIFYFIFIIFFFFYFFPISSGAFVDPNSIENLRWLSSWVF